MGKHDGDLKIDKSLSGVSKKEAENAEVAWFGPEGEPESRFRYFVIKEEGDVISLEPGEVRFKKGLTAARYADEETQAGTVYVVTKTRPNRIDLRRRQ